MDPIRNIVVPTDFSPWGDAACARAALFARTYGAAVHVVHALGFPITLIHNEVSLPPDFWDDLRRAAQEPLERARKAIEASGVPTVTAQVASRLDPVVAIQELVRALDGDLVVMGTHGRRGLEHAFLGSVAERALRTVDRPILAVKEDPEAAAKPISRILLAVDFSPHSDAAVEITADVAERFSASVDVVHAFDFAADYRGYLAALAIDAERKIERNIYEQLSAIRSRLEQRGIRAHANLRFGHPASAIADEARQVECQLIVMGTRGLTGLSHVLLGSVAERTLRAAPCSVLCVKAVDAAGTPRHSEGR
jgi:nucleotide-binding universal stress UspA family protein